MFVTAPPSPPSSNDFGAPAKKQTKECSTSNTAPVLDVIATGLQIARTVYAVAAPNSVYNDPNVVISREADIALGTAFTFVHFSSAVWGFKTTSACRDFTRGFTTDEYAPPPDWLLRDPKPGGASATDVTPAPTSSAHPARSTPAPSSPATSPVVPLPAATPTPSSTTAAATTPLPTTATPAAPTANPNPAPAVQPSNTATPSTTAGTAPSAPSQVDARDTPAQLD